MLLTFEGLPGCGKTTQLETLRKKLVKRGVEARRASRYFWNTANVNSVFNQIRYPLDQKDRPVLETVAQVFVCEHYANLLLNLSYNGPVLLRDRGIFSTVAYMSAALGSNLGRRYARHISKLKGDVTIIIDVSPEASMQRSKGRHGPLLENIDYLRAVRTNYIRLARLYGLRILDGENPRGVVQRQIEEYMNERMRLHPPLREWD